MRILIVSYCFPPYNVIGAVRAGRVAWHLARRGHDVRVLAADRQPFPPTLELPLDGVQVTRTPWWDIYRPVRRLAAGGSAPAPAVPGGVPAPGGLRRAARRFLRDLVYLPDPEIGWYPPAVRGGRRVLRGWRPDVIFASAKPFTSLLVARRLARASGAPWVAELRDLWVDNHYRAHAPWRDALERRWEGSLLRSARGVVTVTQPFADALRERWGIRADVVYNGYEADDVAAVPRPSSADGPLVVLHAGNLYAGRRDASPLVRALALLGERAREVVVRFVGTGLEGALAPALRVADELGVRDRVELAPGVSYAESLRLQREADVLLLLTWNNPEERGTIPGKLFEYLGARRPILASGCVDGVVNGLVEERRLGKSSNDPAQIAAWLGERVDEKRRGGVSELPEAARAGLSRKEQVAKLELVLRRAAAPAE